MVKSNDEIWIYFFDKVAKRLNTSIESYSYNRRKDKCLSIGTTADISYPKFMSAVINELDNNNIPLPEVANVIENMSVMQHIRRHVFYFPDIIYSNGG